MEECIEGSRQSVRLLFKGHQGSDKIRGMLFDMAEIREIHLNSHAFSEMANLKLLIVNNLYLRSHNKVHGFDSVEFDFSELRCLCWDHSPFPSLPLKFDLENLVVLKMQDSNLEQLWTGIKNLPCLKYIDLSYSKHLLKVPDLSEALNLEWLILEDCTSLFEITPPSRNLHKLVNLNLRNCKSLISLPIGIQSKSLRDVILSGCSNFNTAPRISCNMESLCLDGTAIKKLSSSVESPSRLVELCLKHCLSLESLPNSVCNLKSLRRLDLSGLSNLKMVPEIPCNIEELYLDGTAIEELSSTIENVSNLERLSLRNCSSLECLPNGICKLKFLKYLCISGCSKFHRLPEDIGNLQSLEVLEANGISVRELPSSMVYLTNLHVLTFEGSKVCDFSSLLSPVLSGFQCLQSLNLNHCNLTELPDNLGQLSSLRDLELVGNNFSNVPASIMNLSNLWHLDIRFCNRLQALPKLPCNIQELKAEGCKLLKALSGWSIPSQKYNDRTLSFINCFSLDWNAIRNILNDTLFKMYQHTNLLSKVTKTSSNFIDYPYDCFCFPGSEIPKWFNIQSNGFWIELPRGSFNQKFLGFVFCAIVSFPKYRCLLKGNYALEMKYELLQECERGYGTVAKGKFLVDGSTCCNSDHVFLGYNFNACGCCELSFNTKAIIIFNCNTFRDLTDEITSNCYIEKCGVRLLFTEEFKEPIERSRCFIFGEEEKEE